MTPFDLGLIAFPVLLVLILIRIPIMVAMFCVGVLGQYLVFGNWIPIVAQMKSLSFSTFSSYSLSVVPMFLLMGQFASRGGLSKALFDAAHKMVGHRRGGLALSTIAACGGWCKGRCRHRLPAARCLRPGKICHSAGRAERYRHHSCDRARGDPRSHRTHAAPFRSKGRPHRRRWCWRCRVAGRSSAARC